MKKGKMNKDKIKSIKPPAFAKLNRIYKDIDWGQFKNKPVIPIGKDTPTNNLVGNLENLLSLFVVGRNNSERGMFLNCSIVNILKNTKPKDFKLILIDTNKSNLRDYKNLPNLLFSLITDEEEAKKAIEWCDAEVNRRFNMMIYRAGGFIDGYNKKFKKDKVPRILVVINDYSDLSKKYARYFKKTLYNINVQGALYGVHLLVSSSRLSKENCHSRFSKAFYRVAFRTNSSTESKVVIGNKGAEKLEGKGDALFKMPSEEQAVPIRCFTVSKKEIRQAVTIKEK